ncbi:E3 ubiquitin-protein ligase UPL5-like isoform X2 [Solanum lycopersicum]|uniref:E3 ubiquitin-protein ligase UPL5-like isoform X2 n=1 Tax=Solanum lycopersicum TaxID=4081 RepID=UPI003747A84B
MLREGRHKNEEFYEMLICRSRLFEESFKYIGHASPRSLQGQLFMQFENEEATGPGVLRERFSLVCEAIFNTQHALFVSCPNDGRRFFPNPAGEDISFEDIRDEDPYLYNGCKKILEMDTKMVDEDTFVCEDEELGSRKMMELCPNGKNTMVNSENRNNYVNLLVEQCFVTSIAHQVAHFDRGFADIITD